MFLSRLFLIWFLLVCVGCGSLYGEHGVFRGKKKDYLKTGSLEPITLPDDVKSRALSALYEVPLVEPRDEFGDTVTMVDFDVPRPDPINTEKGKTGVKIQRIGDKRWVFLNASTSQVWPRTQNYLSSAGFSVVKSNPVVGLIETGDVLYGDDKSRKSRFRISIEKGVHPETTEIHIRQMDSALDQNLPRNTPWPKRSTNIELENKLMDSLAGTLAQNITNNSASLLGQNVGGSLKVEFLKRRPEPTMRLNVYRQRARATVSHALKKEGFVIWDKQDEKGIYYVGFDPKEGKSGFMFGMFGDSFPDKAPYKLDTLLAHLSSKRETKQKFAKYGEVNFGDPLDKKLGFLVLLDSTDAYSDLVIRDMAGEKLPADDAKGLLRIIRKNLI